MAWEDIRQEIKQGKLRCDFLHQSGIEGTMVVIAATPSLPHPVGNVWYRFNTKTQIAILHSYVHEELRRCGVRTAMHEFMLRGWSFQHLQQVFTGTSTELSKPWLQKMGFEERDDGWYLDIKEQA